MNNYLREKAKKILSEILEIEVDIISNDANPNIIKNWDSLNQVKLSIELEKQLERKLTTEEILSLTSLESIISILAKIDLAKKSKK